MFKVYHKLMARYYGFKLRQLDYPKSEKYVILGASVSFYNSVVDKWVYHRKKLDRKEDP